MGRSVTATLLQGSSEKATPDASLFNSAVCGDLAKTTSLLEQGADPNGFQDPYGGTALIVAPRGGYHRLTAALVEAGADLDAQDMFGCTALMAAVRKVHPGIVRILLRAGASVNICDAWGHLACERLVSAKDQARTDAERCAAAFPMCGVSCCRMALDTSREIREMLLGSDDADSTEELLQVVQAQSRDRAELQARNDEQEAERRKREEAKMAHAEASEACTAKEAFVR